MKNWLREQGVSIAILLVAFIAGYYLGGRGDGLSDAVRQELEDARNQVRVIPAVAVETVPVTPETDTVFKIIREYEVDTVIREIPGAPQVMTRVVAETVWVSGSEGFAWSFAEDVTSYRLSGECHANLADPSLSYTTINWVDINQKAICPKRYRLLVGGGVVAGDPFIAVNLRLGSRWYVGPNVAFESAARWGGQVHYGLW